MSSVRYEIDGRIGVVTLDRPSARNAVDEEMARGIEAAVDRIESDSDVWVGVLTANTAAQERPVFCAGADLKVIERTGSAAALDTERGGFGGFVFRERTKPIVAAVYRLPRAVGRAAAMDAILTGEPIPAERAYALGLVSRLVEPGQALAEALRVAQAIAVAAPLAVQASRRFVLAAANEPDDDLRVATRAALDALLTTEDAAEGLRAFTEKRDPEWRAR